MRILPYICSGISLILGIYELTWIGRSNIAIVIALLAFIIAINSFVVARKEKNIYKNVKE